MIDPTLTDDAADRIYTEYIAGYENAWSLFPDVLPCLDMLSRRRLGIISNGLISEQRKKLVKTGIDGRFEFVLISEGCGWAKPSSEIFHHACAAMGECPAYVTYVGNHYDLDACAARQAGLTGVWLDRCGRATGRHLHPIITKLDQLPVLLK